MEYSETILLGVVSGVITSFILYWLAVTFTRIILPWYQRIIYKGIDVSGEWVGKLKAKGNDDVHWDVSLNLKQSAHSITGMYTAVKYVKGCENRVTNMSVSGEVWEGFVSLQCRTISNRNLSFGSMLLKINDSELKGQQIFRNLVQAGPEIVNMELALIRENKNS
jgi:hypothetical protein